MARSRTLTEIADEAYRLADAEGMTARHPRADVVRWTNKGLAELYDLLVSARGLEWYRASTTIALVAGTTDYALPAAFYALLGARMLDGGALLPMSQGASAELRDGYLQGGAGPRLYQLAGANITILPVPSSGSLVLDYVPAFVDLADDGVATFDGVNGWETYGSIFAARLMSIKDSDETKLAMLTGELSGMAQRVRGLARKRDVSAPTRVRDVRGMAAHAAARRWR